MDNEYPGNKEEEEMNNMWKQQEEYPQDAKDYDLDQAWNEHGENKVN